MNIAREIKIASMEINTILEQLLSKVEQLGDVAVGHESHDGQQQDYESIHPLSLNPSFFKGERPTGVLFGDERVDAYTWQMVFKEILRRSNDDPETHVALMNLRGKISGQKRHILANNSNTMRTPHKIDNNLFIETHYDTETLLRILTKRVLDAAGYDYSHISVAIRGERFSG